MLNKTSLICNICESNFHRLASPYKLTFVLTYRCNFKCQICRIWDNPFPKEFQISEIEKIFKNFKRLNWIDLTGGEITLREDIIDVINVIAHNARKLLIFHISTNGRRPDTAVLMAKAVLKANLIPVINISIDGPRLINDQLRGVNGAFATSLETFKKLKKLSPHGHFYLSCTLSRHNIAHIDDLIIQLKQEIKEFNLSDIHFNLCHASSHYYKNKEIISQGDLNPVAVMKYLTLSKNGQRIKIFFEDQYLKGMTKFLSGDKFPVPCQALNATCFIDPEGNVYPCGIYNEPIGALRDFNYDINKIWHHEKTLSVRGEIIDKQCPGCWSPCEAYPAILGKIFF